MTPAATMPCCSRRRQVCGQPEFPLRPPRQQQSQSFMHMHDHAVSRHFSAED